jgi:hypothetical protein
MAQVRRNPLPAGRYWIWIAADKEPQWLAYRVKNFDVLKIESEQATHEGYGASETRSGTTYIFTTKEPIIWPAGIGFSNTAGQEVKKPSDVIQRGQVPTLRETATEVTDWASGFAVDVQTLVVIGLVVYVLANNRGR